ncbi:MAG: phosphoglycolate phosphatase [Hyphomicrobium sp.]|jgi:phosphoglycolate phosphatase
MSTPRSNLTLAFDLDGTLVDTAPDLAAATNHALADLGLAPVSAAVLRPAIGLGARHMIATGLAATGKTLAEPEMNRLHARFLGYYEANIAAESRPFDGAVRALERFRERGMRLAVCTNKREGLSRQLLEALGLMSLFDALAGRDTFPVNKPHPGHLTGAIKLAGGEPARALMIGDTGVDIATARAAEIPVIACSFGYSDVPLADLAPDRLVHHFNEIEAAVSSLTS